MGSYESRETQRATMRNGVQWGNGNTVPRQRLRVLERQERAGLKWEFYRQVKGTLQAASDILAQPNIISPNQLFLEFQWFEDGLDRVITKFMI